MRKWLAGLLVGAAGLALVAGTVAFGAVTIEWAAPVYALALLLAVLWAFKLLLIRPVSWKNSPLHLPALLFLVYAVIRYFTSPLEYESRLELFQILLYGFFFFLAACNFYRSRDRSFLIALVVVLAMAESIYGFWQFLSHSPGLLHLQRPEQYLHRASGTYPNPNHLAGFLEIVLGMVVARLVIMSPGKDSVQKSALKKVLLGYGALVILCGLIATLSRAGWVATIVGLFGFLFLKGWGYRTIWLRVGLGVTGIILIGLIIWRLDAAVDHLRLTWARYERAPQLTQDATFGTRLAMWSSTWQIIQDHAVLGTGPGTWKWFHLAYRDPAMQMRPQFAHNDFLHLFSDYGLVGFLLIIATLAAFFWHAALYLREDTPSEQRSFAMGTIVAVAIVLVHSLFDFNMHIPANALLLVTLMGCTVAMDDRKKRFSRVEIRGILRYLAAAFLLGAAGAGAWLLSRAYLAQRHATLANEAKEMVDFATAVTNYQQALTYDARFPEPYAKLGDVYLSYASLPVKPGRENEQQQMLSYAIETYHDSLDLNPYQSDVYVRLAAAYDKSGDSENALLAYQKSLEVDPNNAATFFHLGNFYRRHGEDVKAREAFEKSQQLNYWSDTGARLHLEELPAVK